MTSTAQPNVATKRLIWIFIGFWVVLFLCIIANAILLEQRLPIISVQDANQLIKDCKVKEVYEIGSPSQRRPHRLRTVIELKDGNVMQTEYGIHVAVFDEAIKGSGCAIPSTPCEISKSCGIHSSKDES